MRRTVLAAVAMLAFLPAVRAADANWRGFYLGGHLGYGMAHGAADFSLLGIVSLFSSAQDMNGAVYGAQAGYNFQAGRIVLGVEADASASSQKATKVTSCLSAACGVSLTQTSEDSIPFLATLRGRLGYAIDRVLVYATGGAAYATFKSTQTFTNTLASVTTTASDQRLAWVAGAGIEAAFARNWSARLEYLYIDSGTFNTTFSLAGVPLINETRRMTDQIARVGVNYRF